MRSLRRVRSVMSSAASWSRSAPLADGTLVDRVWNRREPGKVFDFEQPFDQVAEAYRPWTTDGRSRSYSDPEMSS